MLFVLILPVVLFLLSLLASRKLSVELASEESSVIREQDATVFLRIKNASHLPLSRVKIKLTIENQLLHDKQEVVFMVPARELHQDSITWRFTSKYSGMVHLSIKKIVSFDYFGLFAFSKPSDQAIHLFFLPITHFLASPLNIQSDFQMESDVYSSSKPGDDSSETFGIREYRPGDSPRAIHWKLSSKLDQVLIRESSLPLNSAYFILVELLLCYKDHFFLQKTLMPS